MAQPPPDDLAAQYLAALRDSDDTVRQEAAKALGELGDPSAVQPLIDLLRKERVNLHNDSDEVWLVALDALQKIGEPAISPLIALLLDEGNDINLRTEAVTLLGSIGDKRAVEPLVKLLTTKDSDSGQAGGGALDHLKEIIADPDLRAELAPIFDMVTEEAILRPHAAWALGALGDVRAVDPLVSVLDDNDIGVREAATVALGELGDGRALEGLIKRLKDDAPQIRGAAAEALGKLGDERALPALLLVQQSQTERLHSGKDVKKSAAEAIESIRGRRAGEAEQVRWYDTFRLDGVEYGRAVEPFIRALDDEIAFVRYSAAQALGELGDWRGVDPLINALIDPDSDLRWYAAEALGKLGDERALPALLWMRENDEGETSSGKKLQEAAAWAIMRIPEEPKSSQQKSEKDK